MERGQSKYFFREISGIDILDCADNRFSKKISNSNEIILEIQDAFTCDRNEKRETVYFCNRKL